MTSATPDEPVVGTPSCDPPFAGLSSVHVCGTSLVTGSKGAESFTRTVHGRTIFRSAMRSAMLLAGCLFASLLSGCGTGFTNDSIPEGRSVIYGRVVASNNPTVGVSNVVVTVYDAPQNGEAMVSYGVITLSDGSFTVNNIATGKHPKGAAPTVSSVTVSVNTNRTGYQPQKVSFLLTDSRPATVVLAVPPTGFKFDQVGGVSVTTAASGANPPAPGSSFAFTAELLDHNNQPIVSSTTGQVYVPNLVLDNLSLVSIGANGSFEASGSSAGATSITGTLNLPSSQSPVTSSSIDIQVTTPQTQELAPGVPMPPAVPR